MCPRRSFFRQRARSGRENGVLASRLYDLPVPRDRAVRRTCFGNHGPGASRRSHGARLLRRHDRPPGNRTKQLVSATALFADKPTVPPDLFVRRADLVHVADLRLDSVNTIVSHYLTEIQELS